MKKILIVLMIFLVSVTSLHAVSPSDNEIWMETVFTFSTSAIVGFCSRPVTNAVPVPTSEKIDTTKTVLNCNLIAADNVYRSSIVYAYAQSYAATMPTFKLSAPIAMSCKNNQSSPDIPYRFMKKDTSGKLVEDVWPNKDTANQWIEFTDKGPVSEPRLVCSYPIQVEIDSNLVDYNKIYEMVLTMEVVGQ